MVPSLTIPRAVYVDLDIDKQADGINIKVGQKLILSKLYYISSVNRMPHSGMADTDELQKYIVNGLFANEDFESINRVTLVTKKS